jgi:hypothetical protein
MKKLWVDLYRCYYLLLEKGGFGPINTSIFGFNEHRGRTKKLIILPLSYRINNKH